MLSLTTSVQCTGTTVQIRRIIYPEGVIKSVTCVCASFDTLCLFFSSFHTRSIPPNFGLVHVMMIVGTLPKAKR